MFCIGYFFGNIDYIKDHFGLVVIAIIIISLIPAAVAFIKSRLTKQAEKKQFEEG
jgi:membrane-associated protein